MKGLVLKILRGTYPPIPSYYGRGLKGLIEKCLKRQPRQRPSVNTILKMNVVRGRIATFLGETMYADEFSHTIMHSNPAKNHLAFTNLNLPGNDLEDKSSKSKGAKKSNQLGAAVGSRPPSKARSNLPKKSPGKYNPAAKYGVAQPKPRGGGVSVQRRRILQQAEKERVDRQRKREAEAAAMRKREEDRKVAREKERLERERRRRDLLVAEKKRREAAALAREQKAKAALHQNEEYEAAVKARHKAFSDRQRRALAPAAAPSRADAGPAPHAPGSVDPVLAEFLARKQAAQAYRERFRGNPGRITNTDAADTAPAPKTRQPRTRQLPIPNVIAKQMAADARSPAPPAPAKSADPRKSELEMSIASSRDDRRRRMRESFANQAQEGGIAALDANTRAGAPPRRQWQRLDAPVARLNPVGTQAIGGLQTVALGETTADISTEATPAPAAVSQPNRKRWGAPPAETPKFMPVGTSVLNAGSAGSTQYVSPDVTDASMTSSIDTDSLANSTQETVSNIEDVAAGSAAMDAAVGATTDEAVAVAVAVAVAATAAAAATDDEADNATVAAGASGDDGEDGDKGESDEVAKDQEDDDYAEMLCTMRSLLPPAAATTDDPEAVAAGDDGDDDDGAAVPGEAATAGAADVESDTGDVAPGTPTSSTVVPAPASPAHAQAQEGAGTPVPAITVVPNRAPASSHLGPDQGASAGNTSAFADDYDDDNNDLDDSYFEDDSEADDILLGDGNGDDDTSDDDGRDFLSADLPPESPLRALAASPLRAMVSDNEEDDDEEAAEMYDTMRRLLANATPEKQEQLIRAVPEMAKESLLKSGPVKGLRLKGESIRSLRVEREHEYSVFHKLEEARVKLEDALGPLVFTKTYRLIQAWREADDDDDSDARRKEIEQLLETKQSTAVFPKLLHLVVSDATHYDANAAESVCVDDEDDEDIVLDDLDDSESLAQETAATEDGDADIEGAGATPVSTDVGEANKASDSTDDAAATLPSKSSNAGAESGDGGNVAGDEDIEEDISRGKRTGSKWYAANG